MKKSLSIAFLFVLVVCTFFILNRSKYREAEGRIFGTTYHIKYAATHSYDKEIAETLQQVDAALSMFNDTSILSRFNRGEEYPDNALFEEVVRTGLRISEETDGAFDMTVAPLVNAWGFGLKNKESVTDAMVDSIMEFVGYKYLTYNPKSTPTLTRTNERTSLDCGAIAKGFGVQQVARLLTSKGCTNYMVEIGGEVALRGNNPQGKKWTLGINKPVDDSTNVNNEIIEVICLTDKSVATSGNYRNFYYQGKNKYAHTINPHTGYPVEHSLLSATVVHASCTEADAYATSFMVMGLEDAQQFIKTHKGIEAYLIYSDANGNLCTWQSEGFAKYQNQDKQ